MLKRILTLFMVLGVFYIIGYTQPVSNTYGDNEAAGTYTFVVPAGYSANITVEAWGGGGGGGAANGNTSEAGGGGGGYSTDNYPDIGPGSYTIVVGAGGAPGAAGGDSSYDFGTLVTAGGGGFNNSETTGGAGGTGNSVNGGNGGTTNGNNQGGGGGGGSGPGATAGASVTGGTGGIGGNPNGGAGGSGGAEAGTAGGFPGGGGGGRGKVNNDAILSGAGSIGQVIVTVNSFLPVELTSFTGKPTSNAVALNWQTASELNNEKFVIERSTDRRNYQAIGEVLGQGTTNLQQDYHFMDKYPAVGMNYYRLKQMDWDGQYEYSNVISVQVDGKASYISIVPNPAQSTFRLQFASETEGEATVTIHDMLGKRMQTQLLFLSGTAEEQQIDVSQLPAGVYTLSVVVGNQHWEERLVIE